MSGFLSIILGTGFMKLLTLTLSTAAILALTACQTTGPAMPSEAMLLSSIPVEKISPEGAAISQLSTANPTCVEFYKNSAVFAEAYKAQLGDLPKAPGGGFGSSLLKTVALGTLAGAASGGVGSLGIGSSFLELALASTASQVVFQGGNTALEAVAGNKEKSVATDAMVPASPLMQIETAAAKIGCPAPDAAALGLDLLPTAAGTAGDHTHSASEHTHTKDGQTYTHTH